MPDTLVKFGGIWLCRFRDLACEKLKNLKIFFENCRFSDETLNKFIKEIIDFQNFSILRTRDLEIYITKSHQISRACQACSERLRKSFLGREIKYCSFCV